MCVCVFLRAAGASMQQHVLPAGLPHAPLHSTANQFVHCSFCSLHSHPTATTYKPTDLHHIRAPLVDLEVRGVPALQYFGNVIWQDEVFHRVNAGVLCYFVVIM